MKIINRTISIVLSFVVLFSLVNCAGLKSSAISNNDTWKEKYCEYVQSINNLQSPKFALLDVDDDGVPELFFNSNTYLRGGSVSSYSNNTFLSVNTGSIFPMYSNNKIYYYTGQMGLYEKKVYEVNNSKITCVFYGMIQAKNTTSFDMDNPDDFYYRYRLNDNDSFAYVSYESFNNELNKVFDFEKSTSIQGNYDQNTILDAINNYHSLTDDSDVDNYIIDQVKKYTSENITNNTQYNAIMNANVSGEIKLYRLNELFKNEGFTDAKSGIDYLRDTSTYRNDYNFLITDEIFCANNFYEWLYSSSGTIPRGLLYTDGWIFNGELSAYLDITTYTDKDFPNVKKNKKFLKDFLEQDTKESIVLKEAKTVGNYLEKLIKLNNIEYVNSIKELHQKINHAKSLSEIEQYQNQLASLISAKVNSNYSNKIYLDGDRFSEALGYSVSVIEFTGATVDNIIQMVNLDKEIAKYQYYKKFLLEIYNCSDVSADMRMAAYLLLDDINKGYYNHIVSILGSCIKLEKDLLTTDFDVWSTVFGTGGEVIGEAISTIKLAAFIDNIIVDTGDFVNQVAYTQGYAEVAKLYSLKLKQDKTAFVLSPTKENAWQFFEDYTMLWSLRYKGEEQYLRMNKVKMFIFGEVKTSDYTIKSDVVNDNLSFLNQKKFEFATNYTIPEGVMYSSKAVINCPVDVYVYSSSGGLIATLKDGIESDISNEYGRFAVMKQSYSGEYAKVIALKNTNNVIIKSVAHSQGLVDYNFASIKNGETKVFSINNVLVDDGAIISTSNDSNTFSIDNDGDGTSESNGQLLEEATDYVKVSAISSNITDISMATGEQKVLSISITPENASNKTVDWFTDKEDVVSIKNGVVKALKSGNATVYAKALDADDVICSFQITISEATPEIIKSGTTGDCTWTLDNAGTLTISGNGKMADYSYNSTTPWENSANTPWGKNITNVIVEDGVTSIGEYAFYGCKNPTNVNIPDSVTSIGNRAFGCCSNLTSIIIPERLTNIGYAVFKDCSGIKKIMVNPNNPVYNSQGDCNAIIENETNKLILGCANTVIPNSVTKIGDYAFSGCYGLTSIDIPVCVTSIGYGAFSNCCGLTSIGISDNVTIIESCAFYNCERVKSVRIGNGVKKIGSAAFQECTSLKSIIIPDNVQTIGYNAFGFDNNGEMPEKIDDFIIYGKCGTEAERYANYYGFIFKEWDSSKIIGDANGDNNIDILDATLAQKYAVGKADLTEEQLTAADVNGDGIVDILDAAEIQKYAVGKITEFKKKA